MTRRIFSIVFDDGFEKSFTEIAAIHDAFGLKANLNIIGGAHRAEHPAADEWHNAPVGGWDLWRELAAKGHEIAPHSWSHQNHARIPLDRAKEEVDRCLEIFSTELPGFDARRIVYGFPYNSSNQPIEDYVLTKCRAFRTGGPGLHPLPGKDTVRMGATGFGPGNSEAHLDAKLADLLNGGEGWLVYNLHGLEPEGWGPVTGDYLKRLFARLLKIEGFEILPPAAALATAG